MVSDHCIDQDMLRCSWRITVVGRSDVFYAANRLNHCCTNIAKNEPVARFPLPGVKGGRMSNVARSIIWPSNTEILVRVVVLYVGQGASAVVLIADGNTYKTLLIDVNLDAKNGGIDVPGLVAHLLEDVGDHLDIFANTHPHNDHLAGITQLSDVVDIGEVWHSGHKPGKKHDDTYRNLQQVIDKVKDAGGTEVKLEGSRSPKRIGEAECYILAPAEYVVDDIEGESDDARKRRVHKQCAVLKFGSEATWVLMTGDADRDAWEKHITNYHSERLAAPILEAAHHGSRTFFHYDEADDPYQDALQQISPTYVIISAPKSKESEYDHPHKDAVKRYVEAVGDEDNVLHTGDKRHSFICDIFRDGKYTVQSDNGDLVDAYPIEDDNGDDGGSGSKLKAVSSFTRIDHRGTGSW